MRCTSTRATGGPCLRYTWHWFWEAALSLGGVHVDDFSRSQSLPPSAGRMYRTGTKGGLAHLKHSYVVEQEAGEESDDWEDRSHVQ